MGWKCATPVPKCKKAILIGYPHTSYWDIQFILTFPIYHIVGVFWAHGPPGWVGWLLGQILVGYKKKGVSQAAQIASELDKRDRCWVALWPEGTCQKIRYVST